MNDTYVFLGDSLTFGYGVKPKENWVNKLKQKYNLCIYNKGVNGSTTTDMLFRFQEDVLDLNPNKLFIMGGTNDLLSNRSIDSIISNIELMIKDSLCNNISVIIGIPPTIIPEVANELFMKYDTYEYCKKNLSQLRINLIALCTKYSLPYLDFYSAILSSKNKLEIYSDGIHFSPKGQDILFKESENLILM